MKKNLAKIKVFLTASTWNSALENWGPQQGETILPIHKHSSAPRRAIFHILSNILSRISLTLGSVHAMTLRKITLCSSGVAGGSVLQEPHLMRRITHCSTDRLAGKQLRHAQALLKSQQCTVIYPE